MLFKINTANGAHEVNLSHGTFAEMRNSGSVNIVDHVEKTIAKAGHMIGEGKPTVGQQLAHQMSISPASTLYDATSGLGYRGPEGAQAATVGGDGSVVGRLVVQAVLMQAIEASLRDDLSGYARMLSDNAAIRRSLTTTTWVTPILNFQRPANSRPQPIAQLSEPARMLTLTTSQKNNAIMGDSIGIEYSDQVAKNVTIDVIALSLKRQAEESAAHLAMYQIMSLLNGDVDYGMLPLATVIGGATQASTLDSAAGNGKLTQVAWMKWLWQDNLKRSIDVVVTDFEGALAIQNREGRPIITDDNARSKRINTEMNVLNPRWADEVNVIITQDPTWPAGTIVGFQKKYGYSYITSTAVDYKATEEDVIRRGTRMRFDTGSMVERFMDDAWTILDFN